MKMVDGALMLRATNRLMRRSKLRVLVPGNSLNYLVGKC
jgi:hypothetical protein